MRLLAPVRRATLLVLLGAALVSVALTVGVVVRGPTPMAASVPEPALPAGGSPTSTSSTGTASSPPSSEQSAPGLSTTDATTADRPAPGDASPKKRGPASSSTPAPSAGTFQSVAGPACPVDGTRNVHISTGWKVVPGDSWTGDGCGDRFLYSEPDDANYFQWLFTFDGEGDYSCRVSVFVPDSPLASDFVWYGIGDRVDNVDYRIGGFTVDQKANRGSWVDGATVPVGNGALMVNVDGEQNLTGVAAAPLKVSCG